MKINLSLNLAGPDVALFAYAGSAPLGVPPALAKALATAGSEEGFSGKESELVIVHPTAGQPARRVFLVGLGKKADCGPERLRQRIAVLIRRAREARCPALSLSIPARDLPFEPATAVQAATEAALLASYRFTKHKTPSPDEPKPIETLNLVLPEKRLLSERLQRALSESEVVASGVTFARDLVNEPSSRKPPKAVGEIAQGLARPGRITVKVYHKPELEQLGMGGLLSVAQGSDQPPVFVHLHYRPRNRAPKLKSVALVGKGITFDSGGLNIKTGNFMDNMKDDMSGAAAVLGIFQVLGSIDLPLEVHGLIPLTENMSGGSAIKVGDVFKALNGKTVEILNTDAEGRLILADALSFGANLKPNLMIDIATLTGACVVALGPLVTGALGTDRRVIQKLIALGQSTGEHFWELPLFEGYREWGKSRVADINNIGRPGKAGTIFAGLFLQEFVGQTPWVHLDIAGTAWLDSADEKHYLTAGGTGVPIRTLFALLRQF
ncbi:MAG: leucyl aminopeptidase [candidate division WOR-3 bacterium]